MQLRRNYTRRNAYKSGSSFSIGPATARYIVLLLLAVFSLMYLIQSAQGADSVVQLHSIAQEQTAADKELSTLQVNQSRLQSLQTLQDSASGQGLVPVGDSVESVTIPTN